LQQPIAVLVAEGVVELGEPVDADQDHPDPFRVPRRCGGGEVLA
jgi:hypothetical protein